MKTPNPQDIVADRTEAYYRFKKELRKTLDKSGFVDQENILDEQWWQDVRSLFAYKPINIMGKPAEFITYKDVWWIS